MVVRETVFTQYLLFYLTLYTITTESAYLRKSEDTKKRNYNADSSKHKAKIDRSNPWPFLPSAGSHYAKTKGYPSYPYMILSPPGPEKKKDKTDLHDEQGSKYFTTRRQFVPVPFQQQQTVVGYVPIYYTIPQYQYTQYPTLYPSSYQLDAGSGVSQQYLVGGQMLGYGTYGDQYAMTQNPFLFSKRSKAKKPGDKKLPMKRQFVPRHHWSFSQWPFDSHEYAFTKDPFLSTNRPHLPRWGPIEWGGAGPWRHWAINREGLPSPFGIGLAPHMGGQGYVGLAGRWPHGHGYPLPTHFPTPAHLQHLLP